MKPRWLALDEELHRSAFDEAPVPPPALEVVAPPPVLEAANRPELKWVDEAPDAGNAEDGPYAGLLVQRDQDGREGLGPVLWVARASAGTTNDDGTTDFVASTGAVDRVGDVIDQASWRLASFRANPVILYEHYVPVVGQAVKVGITDDGAGNKRLTIRVLWDTADCNPSGILAAHQHEAGFRHAVSVGFMPGAFQSRTELAPDHPLFVDSAETPRWRAGYLYTRCELLEVSTVAVPANREALQLSMDARRAAAEKGGDWFAAAKTLLRGIAPTKSSADDLLEAARTDPRFRALVLSMVLGEPQEQPTNPRGASPTKSQGPTWVRSA